MKISYPNYYFDFQCIGGCCEATCCKGWKISIDEKSLQKYKRAKGKFANRLKQGIQVKESCFQMIGDRCSMLNADGWCDLQIAMGENALCQTCRSFPRHQEDFGVLQEKMLSLSCPEAARLILFPEKDVKYCVREKQEPEAVTRWREEGISSSLRKSLLEVRMAIEKLYKNKKLPLHVRKVMVTYLAHDVQERLDKNRSDKIEEVLERYDSENASKWFLERFPNPPTNGTVQRERKKLLSVYKKLEIVWPEWNLVLHEITGLQKHWEEQPVKWGEKNLRAEISFDGIDQAKEHLFIYFLHTWFLGALYDKNIVSKINLIFASCEMIDEIALAKWHASEMKADVRQLWMQAAWIYARQSEHSDDNLELLETLLK